MTLTITNMQYCKRAKSILSEFTSTMKVFE